MSSLSEGLRELEAIVGEEHLLTATESVSEYRVDGQQPVAVAMPATAAEVAAVLRAASDRGLSVLLRGAGSHLYLGAPPGPIGVVVSLGRLDRILEYDAGDLTVTAEAGVTLGALQEAVGAQGQMLPLDPPGSDRATLGGLAATNLAGPMRMRHGAPRDLVIGLRVALTNGDVVKSGGKTVKNVAGYELNKLFVGSLGTLGAICESTLRLAPIPEEKAIIAAAMPPERAAELVAELVASRLEIASLDAANYEAGVRMGRGLPVTVEPGARLVFVGLMGDREAVSRQGRQLRALVGKGCALLDGEEAGSVWRQLREGAYPSGAEATMARASVPIARVPEVMELVSSWGGWWTLARAADGMVYAGPVEAGDPGQVNQRLTSLRGRAGEWGGFAVLESGPTELRRQFAVWGQLANVDLMQGLKKSLDPAGVLGAGRFVPEP